MSQRLVTFSAYFLRFGCMLLCLWDIWAWRFAYHAEMFGVGDDDLSWYVTGILILSTITTVLAITWAMARFTRLWGLLFWLAYLILFSYSSAFQFAGHHLLFLIFPFILLLPVNRENSIAAQETSGVIRVFTLILGISSLVSGLSILVSGSFDGRIFDFYLSRQHSINLWLYEHTESFSWGIPWAVLLLLNGLLLLHGGLLCRRIATVGFLVWGLLIITLFRLDFLGFVLVFTALLLFSTTRRPTALQEHENADIRWYDRFPIRQSLAWMLFLSFFIHLVGSWMNVAAIRRVPEVLGYNSQWDYFNQVSWYPVIRLEGHHSGNWVPLIGNRSQRQWNTPEQILLAIPAARYAPPAELSPILTHRMEKMTRRWQIEWGDQFDQYRLVIDDEEYGNTVLRNLHKLPRAYEGSRSKE